MSVRIVVFAYSDVGHACLSYLIKNQHSVVGVVTHEDSAGESIWFASVLRLARENSIPVITTCDEQQIKGWAPDLLFSFYYRQLIPTSILNLARLGAFNMHGSLLPRYRGRAPINWAVLHGETQTGATLHAMVAKADAGDIVDQQAVDIGPNDTALLVQSRVTEAAVHILARQMGALISGTASLTPQQASLATTFGRRRPEDGQIDWSQSASSIHNLVRALTHPYPGAFGLLQGEKTWIWETCLTQQFSANLKPGSLEIQNDQLFVVCAEGQRLQICRLQQAPYSERSAAEFINTILLTNKEAQQ